MAYAVFDPNYYGDLAAAARGTSKGEEIEGALQDLHALTDLARRQNARVVVVLLPPPVWVGERYWDYFKRLGYSDVGAASEPVPVVEKVKEYLAADGVPALDILPTLRSANEKLYLDNDIHLNRRGQELVGGELARFLVTEGLVAKN